MSDMEHNKGKLIPFDLTEDVAKELVLRYGEALQTKYFSSYKEQLEDDPSRYDDNLVQIGGNWYKVEWEIRYGELYGFADVVKDEDGSISFNTWHYNGGAHWTEVVEDALNEKD